MPDFKPLPKPVNMQKPPISKNELNLSVKPVKIPKHKTVQDKSPAAMHKPKLKSVIGSKAPAYKPQRAAPPKYSPVQQFIRQVSGRTFGIAAALAVAFTLIALLIWSLVGHNAIAIYIGDDRFGYIAFSQEFEDDVFLQEIISRLEAQNDARVQINDEIRFVPASSSSRDVLQNNAAIEQLISELDFQIIGVEIIIDGREALVLRNEAQAESVRWHLQSSFLRGYSRDHFLSIEFVENVQFVPRAVDEATLFTPEQAIRLLDNEVTMMIEYTIQEGDNLGAIAIRHNTTIHQLQEDNPYLATILQIGEVIRVRSTRPYLSVRTVEAVTITEPIPIEFIELLNPEELVGFSRIEQEGREGQQEITVHITRINGIQTEQEQVSSPRIIQEMMPEVIEIGTLEIATIRR